MYNVARSHPIMLQVTSSVTLLSHRALLLSSLPTIADMVSWLPYSIGNVITNIKRNTAGLSASAVAAIRPALFLRLTLRHALPGQWTSVGARNWQDQDSFFLASLNTLALFRSSLGGHFHFEMWRKKRASLWQFKSFGLSFWQGVWVCTGVSRCRWVGTGYVQPKGFI